MEIQQPALEERIAAMERKLDAVYVSTERIYKFFLIMMIGSVVLFVLPLIGLIFVVPGFLSTYQNMGTMMNGI